MQTIATATPIDAAYREAAEDLATDGLTFDDDACVSLPDDVYTGAWVQAWVWVERNSTDLCKAKDRGDRYVCNNRTGDAGDGWNGLCGDCADAAERS